MMTRSNPDVRRTLAKLRLVRMRMRQRGALALQGRPVNNAARTDVQQTWMEHGWRPRGAA